MLGTRGSDLARAQTSLVEEALRQAHPEMEIAVEIITTSGDERASHPAEPLDRRAGRKGLFTSEIEQALRAGTIDVAVHSAKDLPGEATAGTELCAALARAPVEDVLVAKGEPRLASLPPGATVATGSVRRQHQLRWVRPDLKLVELRGNVPTRLRKLATNPWDAIVLARAGLERLGFDCCKRQLSCAQQTMGLGTLPLGEFLPAGGQGIVALQIRSDDEEVRGALHSLNNHETFSCLRAEREFLRLLQGDCGTPVGVLAVMEADRMTMRAQIFDADNAKPRTAELQQSADEPERLAMQLFRLINGK